MIRFKHLAIAALAVGTISAVPASAAQTKPTICRGNVPGIEAVFQPGISARTVRGTVKRSKGVSLCRVANALPAPIDRQLWPHGPNPPAPLPYPWKVVVPGGGSWTVHYTDLHTGGVVPGYALKATQAKSGATVSWHDDENMD